MMTDRELLEHAANAAGVPWKWGLYREFGEEPRELPHVLLHDWCNDVDYYFAWDPLQRDERAFKLAMDLRLSIVHESERVDGEEVPTVEVIGPDRGDGSRHCEMHSLDDDSMATVRRCIVLAAAEIGKNSPCMKIAAPAAAE